MNVQGAHGTPENVTLPKKDELHNKYMMRLVKVIPDERDLVIPKSIWRALQASPRKRSRAHVAAQAHGRAGTWMREHIDATH